MRGRGVGGSSALAPARRPSSRMLYLSVPMCPLRFLVIAPRGGSHAQGCNRRAPEEQRRGTGS